MQHNSPRRGRWQIRITIILLSATLIVRAEEVTFLSKQAKDAQTQYQNKISEIKKAAATQMAQAKKKYIAALSDAQKAVQAKDLDEAMRIRDTVKQLTEEEKENQKLPQPVVDPRRSLESRLAGTKWNEEKPGVVWTFDKDGTVVTTDGREGKWAAISGTTILSVFTNGWIDQLQFDENLTKVRDIHGHLADPWQAKRAN